MEQSTNTNGFEQFKLNRQLLNAIDDLGFTAPSPIQEKAIPLALAGHDLFGIAQTGTGKTAAFVLPILMKIKYAQGNNPRALILAPTRELAIQIKENATNLGKYTDLRIKVAFGGIGIKKQLEDIKEGVDILIGTPGRVMDLYATGELYLKEINTMVLDEADRMMDMGFMPQIRQMLEILPSKKRQNLLFSATMPQTVVKLSEEFLEFPETVEVTPQATTAEMVDQSLFYVPNIKSKINLLEHFLSDRETFKKVIVFARKRQTADSIFKYLERKVKDANIRVLHANKGQNTRINTIQAFRDDEVDILVSTDVAARGIDVSAVSHVINFDIPVLYEEYVHRVGRTGRANTEGTAFTFCNPAEKYHLKKIQELISLEIPVKDIPAEVLIEETPFAEHQEMAMEIDRQKRKEDPNYKGAFHEKKDKNVKKQEKKQRNARRNAGQSSKGSSVYVSKKKKTSSKGGGSSRSSSSRGRGKRR
ncbi:DEAD/DEAH box helicase [Sediminitomix flava]|uniref:ATP-dependent RNA helicase RhlE n=1 Tax=Sediminitomix flava TaxID=379075 RepID=A0A315ZB80_SEDFL|nr:DEAD/DEAH box helicase [Sediminitomix flava]PWJ41974.1 ATP-dependent RNA helicase RhlE [Sediminitomix flava]